MRKYIINRILISFPLLLAISFICFCFINLIPSDPAEVALRVNQVTVITPELLEQTKNELGLNRPFFCKIFLLAYR